MVTIWLPIMAAAGLPVNRRVLGAFEETIDRVAGVGRRMTMPERSRTIRR
jgi:hypothetical protein